jgi:hypothetical protein
LWGSEFWEGLGMTMSRSAVWCGLLLAAVGCGAGSTYRRAAEMGVAEQTAAPAPSGETAEIARSSDKPSPASSAAAERDVLKRRIVYRAEVDLVVEWRRSWPSNGNCLASAVRLSRRKAASACCAT